MALVADSGAHDGQAGRNRLTSRLIILPEPFFFFFSHNPVLTSASLLKGALKGEDS